MKASVYKQYLLGSLLVILIFNYVERMALGVLLQNIKIDFGLSDTELGVLSGIAFALFYSVMGLPIARWADRGDRVNIISISTALQCAAVALCATAGNFWQLLAIRLGAAVGEAGCIPPAHSLIADYFTRAERPRAIARYMLGVPLSLMLGYFLGGWLNELYGWRVTFVLLGVPGLPIAAVARLTLREPRKAGWVAATAAAVTDATARNTVTATGDAASESLGEVCVALWRNKTFRHLLLFFSISAFFGYGITQWQPTFFIRSHGLQTGELGSWLAVTYGVGGVLGTYLGGEISSRRAAGNERLQLKTTAIAYCLFIIVAACVYLSPSQYAAFGLLALSKVGVYATYAPVLATVQTLVSERRRAIAVAIMYFFANLIGMGLGPLAVGALSDAFRPWAGDESLRYALLTLCPGYVWAGWHMWLASRAVDRDVQFARRERDALEKRGGTRANTAIEMHAKPSA